MEWGEVSMITHNDQGVPDVRCPRALSCRPPSHMGSPLRFSPFAPGKEAVWFLKGECRCQHQGREVLKDLCECQPSNEMFCECHSSVSIPLKCTIIMDSSKAPQGLPQWFSG